MVDSFSDHDSTNSALASTPEGAGSRLLAGVRDLLQATAYTGIEKPLDGAAQLAGRLSQPGAPVGSIDWISCPKHDNGWTEVGSMIGSVADYWLLLRGVTKTRQVITGLTGAVPVLESGTAGALYQLSMPIQGDDFGGQKIKNMAIAFGTFGIMDGLAFKLKNSGIAGAAGGLGQSLLTAGLYGKPLDLSDVKNDMVSMATFGTIFGAMDSAVNRGTRVVSSSLSQRALDGKPLFSLGPIEILPRGFADRAERRAAIDEMTGFRNKAAGTQALHLEMARVMRQVRQNGNGNRNGTAESLSVASIDADNFWRVNDRFGHPVGDKALTKFAANLSQFFRRGTDIPVRDGGDEFLYILPSTPEAVAVQATGKLESGLRLAVSNQPTEPERMADNFKMELEKQGQQPRQVMVLEDGQELKQIAQRVVSERMSLTGESLTPEYIGQEVARLAQSNSLDEANPRLSKGMILKIYDDADLHAFGERAAYRFLPKIGQVLKIQGAKGVNGEVNEEVVQKALEIQKSEPADNRRLIGQILVDMGYARQSDLDSAFSEQSRLNQNLLKILEQSQFLPSQSAHIVQGAHFSNNVEILSKEELKGLRRSIPDALRPQLEKDGIRTLQFAEVPLQSEVLVGASAGATEFIPGETIEDLKMRADRLLYASKQRRLELGLRQPSGRKQN